MRTRSKCYCTKTWLKSSPSHRRIAVVAIVLCFLLTTWALLTAGENRNDAGTEAYPDPGTRGPAKVSIQQRFHRLKPAECGVGRILRDVSFHDIDGVKHRLADFKSNTVTVVAVTSTSCPLSKRYLPTLARLEKIYSKHAQFLFVSATETDKDSAIRTAIQRHALTGPFIRDPDGVLLAALGAKSTTDCFVIDKALTLCYRGAIDDQYGFGYALAQPRQQLLKNALEAVLDGRTPQISATDAPGCLLNLKKPLANGASNADKGGLTYHKRISRIIQSNCVECHRDGGAAPFPLTQPADVTTHANMIEKVLKEGTMPPWFAAPSRKGATSVWANDRSLAAADKADLETWLKGDRALGDPADAPVPAVFTNSWQMGEPDAIVQLPTTISIPAEGIMPYERVTVATTFSEDKWVSGFDFRPTARDVVHHVGVFVQSRRIPEQQGSDPETIGAYLALYVPGNSWHRFPPGCAKFLPKGSTLLFQIHYTPNGTATQDQTQLALYFAKSPPLYELHVTGVADRDLKIPPRTARYEASGTLRLTKDVQVLSFLPHMHVRGKAFRFQAVYKGGNTTTLLAVPRYDFNWQLAYHLAEPLSLPKGTTLKVTGWYDNSAQNPANPDPSKTVYWGPQTSDEMLLGYFEYIVPSESLPPETR